MSDDAIARAIELHEESARLEQAGDLAGAEAACREALEIFERDEGSESPDVANLLFSLGSILEAQGRFHEAAECARRSVELIEPLLPAFESADGKLILLHALGLWGGALRQSGDYRAAEAPLLRAIDLAHSLPGEAGESVRALNNFGVLCKFAGWFDRGQEAYQRALEIAQRVEDPGDLIATLLHNIGGLEHARGRYDLAEPPSKKAWEMRRNALGEDHPQTLADGVAYAAVLDGLERYSESLPIYQHAVEVYERMFGPEHYEVGATLHNLAVVEQARGDLPRAIALARRALDIKRKLLGTEHPDTALSAMNLGAMLFETGERNESRELLSGALAALERNLAPDHPRLTLCRDLLAQFKTV